MMIRTAAVAAFIAATALHALPASAQDWQTMSQSRKTGGEKALRVDVEYAAGRINLEPGTASELYRAELKYDADVFKHPKIAYASGALKIGMENGNVKGRDIKAGRLNLELGTGVPLDIALKFGAAQAQLDLGGLMVRRATFQTGASETMLRVSRPNRTACDEMKVEVGAAKFEAVGLGNLSCDVLNVSGGVGEVILDFSGSPRRDMTANVKMGLGSLVLRIPRGTGLKVTKNGLLASFDSEGMVKRGGSFFSENWNSAQRHVTADIDAAFGSIKVEWIGDR